MAADGPGFRSWISRWYLCGICARRDGGGGDGARAGPGRGRAGFQQRGRWESASSCSEIPPKCPFGGKSERGLANLSSGAAGTAGQGGTGRLRSPRRYCPE